MKKIMLATVLLLSLSASVFAQAKINGKIIDKDNKLPLIGATIQLLNTNKSALSNKLGEFVFDDLKNKTYTIQISYLGYETLSIKINTTELQQLFTLKSSSILKDEVIITATRVSGKTPITFSALKKKELEKLNYGKDLPYLLESIPSVVTTSNSGAGVGYTGIRIRGSDATRINVTLNGISYNDSESQDVYWVNLPDISSSVESIQVQRGVGTSTNGAGAFGASINIQTNTLNPNPYAVLDNSFGSFNTLKNTLLVGTGLLNNKFTIDARLSKIVSDGYLDRAKSNLTSYYISGSYYGKNTMLKINVFSGKEITYQSWNGTPESRIKNDKKGMLSYIKRNKLDVKDAENLLNSGRTYNLYTYDNQVDNYTQTHYQLLYAQDLSNKIILNSALHYTKGKGYYEQYKKKEKLDNYGLKNVNNAVFLTDLIRRRWLDNDFYGFTFSLNYTPSHTLNVLWGGAWNQYDGNHFGEIIWAQNAKNISIRKRYYQNNGFKTDFTMYGKISFNPIKNLLLFADIQYRKVGYILRGVDSNQKTIFQNHNFYFFNPKFGINYQVSTNANIYASFSIGNKEPNRTDFVDAPLYKIPFSETLRNLEVGYKKKIESFWFQTNFYLMDYKNQLVLTGQLNDVGSSLRTNVNKSYRMGVELETVFLLNKKLSLSVNSTLSKNIIQDFNEIIYDSGINWEFVPAKKIIVNHQNTQISFSPNFTAGATFAFKPIKNLEIAWVHKYVGKQYLDNTTNENRKIAAYYISDTRASFKLSALGIKRISITFVVYNLFNKMYETNGYTWGYKGGGNDIRENFYYPQAGIHFIGSVKIQI